MELVTISRVFSPADADLTAARLESAGFTPFVHGVEAALSVEGYSMVTGGIQVKVPADQVPEARRFLEEDPDTDGWDAQFRAVYDRALASFRAGRCSVATLCDPADTTFLRESGCTVQELYDLSKMRKTVVNPISRPSWRCSASVAPGSWGPCGANGPERWCRCRTCRPRPMPWTVSRGCRG